MSQSIDELRAQRALIQQHLDWLDGQIKCAAPTTQSMPTSIDQPLGAVHTAVVTAVTSPLETVGAVQTMQIEPTEEVHTTARSKTNPSDLKRLQLGCVTCFVITALSFLFLLFGLPYLID